MLIYMDPVLKLSCLLISISVSASWGLIAYYYVSKKEEEEDAIASPDDIYEDSDVGRVVIDAGDKEVILSIRAERRLLKILNEREKSSLLYI